MIDLILAALLNYNLACYNVPICLINNEWIDLNTNIVNEDCEDAGIEMVCSISISNIEVLNEDTFRKLDDKTKMNFFMKAYPINRK